MKRWSQGSRRWAMGLGVVCWALAAGSAACGGSTSEPDDPTGAASRALPTLAERYGAADGEPEPDRPAEPTESSATSPATRSPQPVAAMAGRDTPLYRRCGEPDAGLVRAASHVVARRLDGRGPPSPRELELVLRAAGVPQVWPRAWAVAGLEDGAELETRLARWVEAEPAQGRRRCGIARGADRDGRAIVAAVSVDALADLEPIPFQVRPSQWVEVAGPLHVAADEAHVLLLGPRGRPRKVPASLSGGRIRSRMMLDQPGLWLIQVLVSLPSGPAPVLEVRVGAGVAPPTTFVDPPAPGRVAEPAAGAGLADRTAALFAMLGAARHAERVGPLGRDPRLDALAQSHAAAMAQRGRLAHDLGSGTVDERLQAAGWERALVGENVAAASTIGRAHQALWASPSHRENMLASGFRWVGVGVASDARGSLWVAEIFSE